MTQKNTTTEAVFDPPIGITNPSIDKLLGKTSLKYALAIFVTKRAHQINDYCQQIGEGTLEYVDPLAIPEVAEKPLSIVLRGINVGLLDHTKGQSISLRGDICIYTAGNTDVFEYLRVVAGVAGGTATYKAVHTVRGFKEPSHDVRVVPTESALNSVGAATFEVLSGNSVSATVFDTVNEVQHARAGQEADLVVVIPATTNFMTRAARGRADDLLTVTLLVATCPVILAPATYTKMQNHLATHENVETLRRHDMIVLDPIHGRLTGKDAGPGRLPEPEQIALLALVATENPRHLRRGFESVHFMITAGGTRGAINPVRFIGNYFSGRQGYALTEMTAQRGIQVTVVAGHTDQLATPLDATIVKVDSTLGMTEATYGHAKLADVYILAVAVTDFHPASAAGPEMEKDVADDALSNIQLVGDPDILTTIVQRCQAGETPVTTTIMGFTVEAGDEATIPLRLAKQKVVRKGCGLLICSDVPGGQTFDATDNVGWLLSLDGEQQDASRGSKFSVAGSILDAASELRQESQPVEQPMPTAVTEPLGP